MELERRGKKERKRGEEAGSGLAIGSGREKAGEEGGDEETEEGKKDQGRKVEEGERS